MGAKRVAIHTSAREPLPGATAVGDIGPDERIEVTIMLRARDAAGGRAVVARATRGIAERAYLTHPEVAATRGADRADIESVTAFAREHGLEVVATDVPGRRVVVSGTATNMTKAFETNLQRYAYAGGTYRGRTGAVTIPAELEGVIEGVFGLDDRPQASPHYRRLNPAPGGEAAGASAAFGAHLASGGYTPRDVARLYGFPSDATGAGECIAIIELGGGFRRADLKTYFGQLGIPTPKVSAISVDGAKNRPTTANSDDGEVMLDIEVVGAVAPGAKIAVYFGPNTDRGFLDAVSAAIHDRRHKPSVISISWGGPENAWTAQAMAAMDQAFQDAAALGISIYCASGDDGSDDRGGDGLAHADFPASSPHAVACGGTRLFGSPLAVTDERVWNDSPSGGATGGGISDFFALPVYQAQAGVPRSKNPDKRIGRGLPDVAGDASPVSGYAVRVDGEDALFGGTSAVAPLMAAYTAILNEDLDKPLGFPNPIFYGLPASAFHDITVGDNGAYQAKHGWDPCTGLGRPDGTRLLVALKSG
jgi:kumamolisin